MRIDRFRFREVFPAPRIAQQVLAGNDFPRVFHQRREQLELARGQVDISRVASCGVRILVQGDASCGDGARVLREILALAAAQEGANARNQLAHAEGLGQVVVPSDFKSNDLVELGVARGEE